MQSMAQFEWVTFDDEEPLSPPAMAGGGKRSGTAKQNECKSPKCAEEFEFRAWDGAGPPETDMCAADEVFFKGQLLPFRPSIDVGLFSSSRDSSKCASRSDSMERFSSLTASSSRSISSRSSSCISSVSRSQSSKSFSSATATVEVPRRSISNNFYAQPSPCPQIISSAKKRSAGAVKKTGGSWWGLFRLGLVKTPAIELDDLKARPRAAASEAGKEKRTAVKFIGNGGLSCKCSPSSVDIVVSSRPSISKKAKSCQQHIMYHNRTFEWLEELALAKEGEEY